MAVSQSTQFYVGVDIGGSKILAGLFSDSLQLRGTLKIRTKAKLGKEAVIERVERVIRGLLSEQGVHLKQVRAIGLGAPGVVIKGRVINAYNIGWDNVPIKTILHRRIRIPVFVENDCNLFTFGIHRVELKGKPRTMIGCFLGTGFGGGVIINGELHTGYNHAAGEFGQMAIDKDGIKTAHSFRGSLESLASRTGIVRRLRRAVLEGETTLLTGELGSQLKGIRSRHLRMALTKKDPLVIRVIRNVSEDCGVGVAGLISAFGPECVVLGGGVIEALGKTMLPIIRKTAEAHVLPGTLRGIKIIASKMGDDGGIYGAALHAQEALSNSKR